MTEDANSGAEVSLVPEWVHNLLFFFFGLAIVLLLYAHFFSGFSSNTRGPGLSNWQEEANEMANIGIREETNRIPDLLQALEHERKPVRRNAEWALHQLTGLPWAEKREETRRWWNQFGSSYLQNEHTGEDPPQSPTFHRVRSPEEANILLEPVIGQEDPLYLQDGSAGVEFGVRMANVDETASLQLFPPRVLPYRAYFYQPELDRPIPLHNQYGPTVLTLGMQWFDPAGDLDEPITDETIVRTLPGKEDRVIPAEQELSIMDNLPVSGDGQVGPVGSPYGIVRFVVRENDILAGRGNDTFRIRHGSITTSMRVFPEQVQSVPGMSSGHLESVRKRAEDRGLVLDRVERVRVKAVLPEEAPETEYVRLIGQDTGRNPSETDGKATVPAIPDEGTRWAVAPREASRGTVVYDPQTGWGRVEKHCTSCGWNPDEHLLSSVDIHMTPAEEENGEQTESARSRLSGTRWIMFFSKPE